MTIHKKRQPSKGYTLVEMIVVLVIIVIAASIAFGGLVMYRRYAAFKKNNEYAQTIFSAAQASLSHAKVSGQLEELQEELANGENSGNVLTEGMIENGADLGKRTAEGKGGLYFLYYQKGDKSQSRAEKILYDMLEPYVYDGDILNATYCVEFDAVDGTVLGVCYSEKAKDFSYTGGSTSDASGTVNIKNRKEEVRREILLGYYGVENLSARAPGNLEKAYIDKIELVNEETLRAEWTLNDSKSDMSADAAQYELQLCRTDSDGKEQTIASLVINDDGRDKNKLEKPDGEAYVKCDVWFYDKDGKKADESVEYQFPAWIDSDKKMTLVLDAVDISAQEILKTTETSLVNDKEDSQSYKETYSIRRFTDKPEELYVRIQAFAAGASAESTQWEASNKENAYFADVQTDVEKGERTVDINNARHLFNVRFTESNAGKTASEKLKTSYTQMQNIDWGGKEGIVAHGGVYTAMAQNQYSEENKTTFPTLSVLADGNTYSGKGKKISNLYVAGETGPLGLFGINRGTIKNLTMTDCVISGENAVYVGSFCGVNAGRLDSLTAEGEKGEVIGGNYTGGIAGSDGYGYIDASNMREAGKKREYEYLSNEVSVTGKQAGDDRASDASTDNQPSPGKKYACNFTGGIIGYLKGAYLAGDKEENDTLILDSFINKGNVSSEYADSSGKSFVGGIVGYAEYVNLFNCTVQDCDISGNGYNDSTGNTAAYTGGITGYLKNGEIQGKTTLKRTGSVSAVYGNIGGIVGKNDAGCVVMNCLTEVGWKIISQGYVNNTGCGGIIGFNASEKQISGNDNFASVSRINEATDVTGTGGIIGRQESSTPFQIAHCKNGGTVRAYALPGGIIGRIKGAGGTVTACKNSGEVLTIGRNLKDNEGAAGIIGNIFWSRDAGQTLTVELCENKGIISGTGNGNGGIIASVTGGGNNKYAISVSQCVNAGRVETAKDTKKNAGILAYADSISGSVTITGSQNYGVGDGDMCGITATASNRVTLQNNFGIASCGIPIAPAYTSAAVDESNYYFSTLKKEEIFKKGIDLKNVTIETEGRDAVAQESNPAANLIDGNIGTRCSYAIRDSQTESTIKVMFRTPIDASELQKLDMYWYDEQDDAANPEAREYSYLLAYLTDDSGNAEEPIFSQADGTIKTFTGIGYKIASADNVDSVNLTQSGYTGKDKIYGIAIQVKGHSHVNRFVSLFEIQAYNGTDKALIYNTVENADTKGTPLGVTEWKLPCYAMNREKNIRLTSAMDINPLELKTGSSQEQCEKVYGELNGKLEVDRGTLSEEELSGQSAEGFSIKQALQTITDGAYGLWDIVNPFGPNKEEDGQETAPGKKTDDKQEAGEDTGSSNETGQTETQPTEGNTENPESTPEPEIQEPVKKELLNLTETAISDSDIPQTAVSWDAEAYVHTYDIVLKADKSETYHYKLSSKDAGAEDPCLVLKETDETDQEGNPIWKELPARKDDKFPKRDTLSNGTTVETYYYPLEYERTIDGITTEERQITVPVPEENTGEESIGEEQPQQNQAGQSQTAQTEITKTETVEVPCQTTTGAYLECIVYTKTDGAVERKLYLALPDIETAEGIQRVHGTMDSYRFTYDMVITNQAAEPTLYEAPKPLHWWREQDTSGNWITKSCELGKEEELN